MKSLILDTSNRYLVFAIYVDGNRLACIQEEGSKRQSENAIPYIEKLLDAHEMALFDFDEIIVTRGPGSYTGERVGLTIAKTLKTVHPQVAVKMISSLQAYAGTIGQKIAVLDARSQKVFVAAYDNGRLLGEETMIEIAMFEEWKQAYANFTVVGQTEMVGYPCPEVDLASHLYALGCLTEPVKSVHELLPTYIKEVEAKKICL